MSGCVMKNSRERTYILSFKVILFLSVLIAVIVGIYSIAFSRYYREYENNVLGEENVRTLLSIDNSIAR